MAWRAWGTARHWGRGSPGGARAHAQEELVVSYRELWARTLAGTAAACLLLALALFDPLTVVVWLACAYAAAVLALVCIERSKAHAPPVDWPRLRWRAGVCACVAVGLPAACAISASSTLAVTLGLV